MASAGLISAALGSGEAAQAWRGRLAPPEPRKRNTRLLRNTGSFARCLLLVRCCLDLESNEFWSPWRHWSNVGTQDRLWCWSRAASTLQTLANFITQLIYFVFVWRHTESTSLISDAVRMSGHFFQLNQIPTDVIISWQLVCKCKKLHKTLRKSICSEWLVLFTGQVWTNFWLMYLWNWRRTSVTWVQTGAQQFIESDHVTMSSGSSSQSCCIDWTDEGLNSQDFLLTVLLSVWADGSS